MKKNKNKKTHGYIATVMPNKTREKRKVKSVRSTDAPALSLAPALVGILPIQLFLLVC